MMDTIVMAFDVCVSVSTNVSSMLSYIQLEAPCYSFTDKQYQFHLQATVDMCWFLTLIFQSFAHGELFFIYLIFSGKFRRALVNFF